MQKSTFIKVDRNIKDWRWFQDRNTLQLWIYILLSVNIKEHSFMNITLKRGEMATSYASLSKATGQTVKELRTSLKHLEKTGEVAISKHPKFSVISVLNYDLYQGNGQAMGIVRAEDGQAMGNNIRIERMKITEESKNIISEKKNKKNYSEFVSMEESEYNKLIDEHGKPFAHRCIEILNNYKGSTGKKYKSDYLAIKSWVEDRVKKDNPELKKKGDDIYGADFESYTARMRETSPWGVVL